MNDRFFLREYPAILVTIFIVWVLLVARNWRELPSLVKSRVATSGLAMLGAIFLGGLIVRTAVIPPRHLVYFDEFVHLDIGTNIANGNTFGETTMAEPGVRPVVIVPSWPGGYHALLGVVFKVFGSSDSVAYRFNEIVGAFSVLVIFLLSASLFESQAAGLWAAFLLATLPLHLRHSATTDLTVLSSFWLLGSLLALQLYLKSRTYVSYLLLLSTVAYAVNVRFENILLLPFFGVFLWRHWKRYPLPGAQGYILPHALLFCAIAPVIVISWHNRVSGVPGYSDSMSDMAANLGKNIPGNVLYLLRQPHKSLFLLPLACISLFKAPSSTRRYLAVLFVLGASFVLAASLHVNGNFLYNATARLAMPWLLVLVLAASWTLGEYAGSARLWPAGILAVVSLALCWPAYHGVDSPLPRIEDDIMSSTPLPPNAVIISNCPAFSWQKAHRTSISAAYFDVDAGGLLGILDQTKRPLYLYKGALWYLDEATSRNIESRLLKNHRLEPVHTAGSGPQEFGMYRLVATAAGDGVRRTPTVH